MGSITIVLEPEAGAEVCTLCGGTAPAGDWQLHATESGVICRTCGRQHAPALVALLELAGTAERVDQIGRHTVFPPMTALLELARAAECYSHSKRSGCPKLPEAV